MNRVEQSEVVPFAPAQMFELVSDVAAYPAFLPWCQGGRIEKQDSETNTVEATLDVGMAGIAKSFTTRNILKYPESIDLELARGPFRHLKGQWRFEAVDGNACRVSLALEFELAGGFWDGLFQSVFNTIANSMVTAFCARAGKVYRTQYVVPVHAGLEFSKNRQI